MLHTFYDESLDAFFSLHRTGDQNDSPKGAVKHYTVFWVRKGCMRGEIDFQQLDVGEGSIFFLTPGQMLQLGEAYPEEAVLISFNKNFYCVERHDEEVSCNGLLFNGAFESPVIQLDEQEAHSFGTLLEVMEEEFGQEDRIQREMMQLLLKRLIIKCTRIAKAQLEADHRGKPQEVDLVRAYSALVEKHFREWHKVAQYADQLHRSPKTLSNLFRKYNSKTPLGIIHERIALEAKRILLYSEATVKEAAYALGFDDPAAFSKFFTKMVGQSPSQFKSSR